MTSLAGAMNQKDHFSEKDLAPGITDISKLQPALVGDPQRSFDTNKQVYSEYGAQAGNLATTKQNVATAGNLSTKSTQWGQNETKSYVSAFGNAEQSGHALNAAANYQKTLGSTDAAAAEITKSIAREIGDKEDDSNTNSDVIAGAIGTALKNGASVDMAREAGQAAKNALDTKAGKKPAAATKSGTKISSGQNAGVESKTSSDAKHAKSVSDANTIKRARSDKLLSDYKQTHGSAFGQGVSDTNTSSQTRTNTTGVGFTEGGGITFNEAEFAGNTNSVGVATTSTTTRDNLVRNLASDEGAVSAARALKKKYGANKLAQAAANDDLGRFKFNTQEAQDVADGLMLEQAYGSGLPNGASAIQGAVGYAPPPPPPSTVDAEVKKKTEPEAQKIKDQEAMAHLRDAKMKEVKTGMPPVTKQMQAIYESERRDLGSISSKI